jgi:hypothetical protein
MGIVHAIYRSSFLPMKWEAAKQLLHDHDGIVGIGKLAVDLFVGQFIGDPHSVVKHKTVLVLVAFGQLQGCGEIAAFQRFHGGSVALPLVEITGDGDFVGGTDHFFAQVESDFAVRFGFEVLFFDGHGTLLLEKVLPAPST